MHEIIATVVARSTSGEITGRREHKVFVQDEQVQSVLENLPEAVRWLAEPPAPEPAPEAEQTPDPVPQPEQIDPPPASAGEHEEV